MAGVPEVPSIFWIALAGSMGLAAWTTIVGSQFATLLPNRLRPAAKFYLAPALGLAVLVVVASLIGRWTPLGGNVLVPVIAVGAPAWALLRIRGRLRLLRHAAAVAAFCLACGSSLLAPLLVYGAFNAHNDAFTYLAHSGWLQTHAFSETIAPEAVTPLTTQIMLYQLIGLRMGGSFLLALVQAALGLEWAFAAYPAVVITAMTASCLAIGYPLAGALRRFARGRRLLLLGLPAFGLGGLVYAANLGFLPQAVGTGFACSLLFLFGPLIDRVARGRGDVRDMLKPACLGALLLTALTLAYSELVPFVALTLTVVAVISMVRRGGWLRVTIFGLAVAGLSLLLLNTEILRAYHALKAQAGAVVGGAVVWNVAGFLGHALGVHGGLWDQFDWARPNANWGVVAEGAVLLAMFVVLFALAIRRMWRLTVSAALLPVSVILAIFAAGFVYFRYGVASPFPTGTGQSWSQFKLSDWAHPYVAVLVLLAFIVVLPRHSGTTRRMVTAVFVLGLIGSCWIGIQRVRPMAKSYDGTRDLARFYTDVRQAVQTACAADAAVYLAIADIKFRQSIMLYLPDRQVQADWTGDDYIENWLPANSRHLALAAGQCVVERKAADQVVQDGREIGPLVVGRIGGEGMVRVASVDGAHGHEGDGKQWWRWIEKSVTFNVQSLLIPDTITRTRVSFGYETRGPQTLTLGIEGEGSDERAPIVIASKGEVRGTFDQVLDVRPSDIRRITIATETPATPLQAPDTRLAAWRIIDFKVETEQ